MYVEEEIIITNYRITFLSADNILQRTTIVKRYASEIMGYKRLRSSVRWRNTIAKCLGVVTYPSTSDQRSGLIKSNRPLTG